MKVWINVKLMYINYNVIEIDDDIQIDYNLEINQR